MMKDYHRDFALCIQKMVLKRLPGETPTDIMAHWLQVYEKEIRKAVAITVAQFADEEEGASRNVLIALKPGPVTNALSELHTVRARLLRDVARMIANEKKG